MAHDHHHEPANYNRAFALGVALNVIYILVEVAFGLLVNSLALLADAGHNLSDVLGLLVAWAAHLLARIKPTERFTYGWRSTSIFAALFNALVLLVAVGGIAWEAIRRFGQPAPIDPATVMWVAGFGVVINTATALLFLQGRKQDLNLKGAFLHMAADAGVSLGVVVAGVAIAVTGMAWIDPATSLLIAAVILIGTWGLLRDSMHLALQAVPAEINLREVREYLAGLEGVAAVHDLHVWAMSTTETALTVHLVIPHLDNPDHLLAEASHELHERFRIEHVTIQVERDAESARCRQVAEDSV